MISLEDAGVVVDRSVRTCEKYIDKKTGKILAIGHVRVTFTMEDGKYIATRKQRAAIKAAH